MKMATLFAVLLGTGGLLSGRGAVQAVDAYLGTASE
jgi:hypothetical protein